MILNASKIDYISTIPRWSVAVVFLWFGLDKFINFQYYLSWFSATQSIRMLLPFSTDLSIHILGIVEIVICVLLFLGIKTRVLSVVVMVFLAAILFSAKYPSSFPQDLGLIGISLMMYLAYSNSDVKQGFLKYSWIARYAMATVLVIWAIDYFTNYQRHEGWLYLSSTIFSSSTTSDLLTVILTIGIIELSLAVAMLRNIKKKYFPVAAMALFLFTIFGLDMPASNHQSLGFAVISGWLLMIALQKSNLKSVQNNPI